MYNSTDPGNKKVTIKRGKTLITLALGCGYNPDECEKRNISGVYLNKPYLQHEGTWYIIKESGRFDRLSDIEYWLKHNSYSEEQFLENIFKLIGL